MMMSTENQKVYLDHMANTPVDSRVLEAMVLGAKENFGNPSNLHDFGQATASAFENARLQVASLIKATPQEIIFTSCGTESNNLALRGIAKAYEKKGKHIITSAIEHFSILYTLKEMEKEGFKVTYLPVDKFGLVDPQAVAQALTPETILITLTHASNEIGTTQSIAQIGAKIKAAGSAAVFHVDAVQTAGNIPIDVNNLKVDALSLSANAFYGPTGTAALYLRKGTRLVPQLLGGTQEEGRRAGTNNIPGIIGLGKAAQLAEAEMTSRAAKLVLLRDKLLKGLSEKITDLVVTGHLVNRLPGHASVCVKFVEGESMSMFLNMEGIAVSTGSACVSKALKASHVLLAIGISPEDVHGSLVFSLGKDSTEENVEYVLEKLPPIVERLRAMSPLYPKK